MTALEQQYGYWGEYPSPLYSVREWQNEVADLNTKLGYWDWVEVQIEQSDYEETL